MYCELILVTQSFVICNFQKGSKKLEGERAMAVHDDTIGQKEKSSDALDEIPIFNVENMQNNTRIINYRFTHCLIVLPFCSTVLVIVVVDHKHVDLLQILLKKISILRHCRFLLLQSDVYVHHRWSNCRNFGIHCLDRIYFLLLYHGYYYCGIGCKDWFCGSLFLW